MILTRTPLRISLGGGGTDLPFYANRFGGSLICGAINKYVYISVSKRVQKGIKLNYSQTEIVDNVDDIKHPLLKEALKLVELKNSLEIHSSAEVPSGTGLGSSSSFLVGLLNALYFYKKELISNYKLAEDSSYIMMDKLKEHCGKQDQYACAFGSLNHLKISTNGRVTITPINISYENIKKLERNLMMFYTGFIRSSKEVLAEQNKKCNEKLFDYYHEIKRIGDESKKCLENGDLKRFGSWMNVHWGLKRNISKKMSNSKIDEWYQKALANGAIGGKIVGAGGGGFLMLYVEDNHEKVMKVMIKEGLTYLPFKFDFDGSRIVYKGDIF